VKQHASQSWATGNGAPSDIVYDQHFYSGQDCFVFLYPHAHNKLVPIPVTQLSVGISQQKIPIYGAWSYRFDAVAKGQVIVQGEFSIVYSYPNMIGQMLGAPSVSDHPPREKDGAVAPLMDRKKSLDATKRKDLRADIWNVGNDVPLHRGVGWDSTHNSPAYPFGRKPPKGKPEADYAGHQPFDIVIAFGSNPSMRFEDSSKFDYSTWAFSTKEYMKMMSSTPNEAARGWDTSRRMRVEHVELTSSGTLLEVSGQPLQETYAFFARDITAPLATK
jgi:hypothetical protein